MDKVELRNGGSLRPFNDLLATALAHSRRRLLARRQCALSGRQPVSYDCVQRAHERSAGIGRTRRHCECQTMDELPYQLDGMEPRSDGSGACGSRIAQHRAPLLSGATVMSLYRT